MSRVRVVGIELVTNPHKLPQLVFRFLSTRTEVWKLDRNRMYVAVITPPCESVKQCLDRVANTVRFPENIDANRIAFIRGYIEYLMKWEGSSTAAYEAQSRAQIKGEIEQAL